MKYLILFIFSLFTFIVNGQEATLTDYNGVITFTSASTGGTGDAIFTCGFSDATNTYLANQLLIGDIIYDNNGNKWIVININGSTFTTFDVDVNNLGPGAFLPALATKGLICRATALLKLPLFQPDNSTGLSQQLKSRIETDKSLLIDRFIKDSIVTYIGDSLLANNTFVTRLGDSLVNNNQFTTNLAGDTNFVNSLVDNDYYINILGDTLSNDSSFVQNLVDNDYFTTILAGDTSFIDSLITNQYFTINLAGDTTFVDSLLGNQYFITNLAGDTNLINSITNNQLGDTTYIQNLIDSISNTISNATNFTVIGDCNTFDTIINAPGDTIYLPQCDTIYSSPHELYTFENGIQRLDSNRVRLGGNLLEQTTIFTDDNTLLFFGDGNDYISFSKLGGLVGTRIQRTRFQDGIDGNIGLLGITNTPFDNSYQIEGVNNSYLRILTRNSLRLAGWEGLSIVTEDIATTPELDYTGTVLQYTNINTGTDLYEVNPSVISFPLNGPTSDSMFVIHNMDGTSEYIDVNSLQGGGGLNGLFSFSNEGGVYAVNNATFNTGETFFKSSFDTSVYTYSGTSIPSEHITLTAAYFHGVAQNDGEIFSWNGILSNGPDNTYTEAIMQSTNDGNETGTVITEPGVASLIASGASGNLTFGLNADNPGMEIGTLASNDEYFLPKQRPSISGLPSGTYIPAVLQNGNQGGVDGWFNIDSISSGSSLVDGLGIEFRNDTVIIGEPNDSTDILNEKRYINFDQETTLSNNLVINHNGTDFLDANLIREGFPLRLENRKLGKGAVSGFGWGTGIQLWTDKDITGGEDTIVGVFSIQNIANQPGGSVFVGSSDQLQLNAANKITITNTTNDILIDYPNTGDHIEFGEFEDIPVGSSNSWLLVVDSIAGSPTASQMKRLPIDSIISNPSVDSISTNTNQPDTEDRYVIAYSNGGVVTYTLDDASPASTLITIKRIGSNTVTVSSTDDIRDTGTGNTTYSMVSNGESKGFLRYDDGSSSYWVVIN